MRDDDLEISLQRFFAKQDDDVVAVYVFGSHGRGQARPESDIDIGVLLAHPPQDTLEGYGVGLAGELELLLGCRVDLIILNTASADLVHRVLRDGRLAFERDRSRRIGFEVRKRAEYFDLVPILSRYRRAKQVSR